MRCRFASIVLKALVLLFAFVVGVGLTRIVHQKHKARTTVLVGPVAISDYASLQRVTFCDLRAAPELYVDKVLVLPLKHRKSGMIRSDELCMQAILASMWKSSVAACANPEPKRFGVVAK